MYLIAAYFPQALNIGLDNAWVMTDPIQLFPCSHGMCLLWNWAEICPNCCHPTMSQALWKKRTYFKISNKSCLVLMPARLAYQGCGSNFHPDLFVGSLATQASSRVQTYAHYCKLVKKFPLSTMWLLWGSHILEILWIQQITPEKLSKNLFVRRCITRWN